MQDVYIKYLMRRLTDEFETGIQDKLAKSFTIRLLIFFGFCSFLFTLYVLFWIPTISKLNTEVSEFSWNFLTFLSIFSLIACCFLPD